MKRDTAREIAVQAVFGAPFSGFSGDVFLDDFFSEEHYASLKNENVVFTEFPDSKSMAYIRRTVNGVLEHLEKIDDVIGLSSRGWSVSRLSGTARAVLRVAVYEILFTDDIPSGAAINSAVEISKKYDEPDVVSFVNGVLGSVSKGVVSE